MNFNPEAAIRSDKTQKQSMTSVVDELAQVIGVVPETPKESSDRQKSGLEVKEIVVNQLGESSIKREEEKESADELKDD